MPFLVYPQVHAPSCLVTDTSEVDVGDVLQSCINSLWSLLAYFSCKLTPTQTSYSTVDGKLLEVYLAIKHSGTIWRVEFCPYLPSANVSLWVKMSVSRNKGGGLGFHWLLAGSGINTFSLGLLLICGCTFS